MFRFFPSAYLSEENVIEKPLKTSSWVSNIKNLGMLTVVWSVIAFIFGASSQSARGFDIDTIVIALVLPCLSALLGVIAIIILKGRASDVINSVFIRKLHILSVRQIANSKITVPIAHPFAANI